MQLGQWPPRRRSASEATRPGTSQSANGLLVARCAAAAHSNLPCSHSNSAVLTWQASLDEDEREVLAIEKVQEKARLKILKDHLRTELKEERTAAMAAEVAPTPEPAQKTAMQRWLTCGAVQSSEP